jgi:hypothetical protein
MAPVVSAEPNGSQALLMFDSAHSNLEEFGWLPLIQKFDGFNPCMARQFALTFDGYRAKVGDVQLEINEKFLSLAMGLPATGQRWSKNCKVEEVPWTFLFQSRKVSSCDKGLPTNMLKQHWHDLLMIVKQFITCEGRYGFVFLHHLRLLMVFMGYELNMPYYLHRSLFKMSKRYKRNQADSSLFHFRLVKIIVVYHFGLHRDYWNDFITRNKFEDSNPPQVHKPVVSEGKSVPPVPYSILLPKPLPDSPIDLPHFVTKDAETVKPVGKKPKVKPTANSKGKKNARLISRMARNKPKPPINLDPIVLSEDSDSEVERFLASEYPYSEGLCAKPSFDLVSNLPPCLQNDPNYPGIKLPCKTPGDSSKPSPALPKPTVPPCDQCGSWLERYYLDVPMLQSKIHSLEDQVSRLTSQKAELQTTDKKQRTTGSILFKNVESATTVMNSKLA